MKQLIYPFLFLSLCAFSSFSENVFLLTLSLLFIFSISIYLFCDSLIFLSGSFYIIAGLLARGEALLIKPGQEEVDRPFLAESGFRESD